jgi:hypothetical protein
MVAPLSKRTFDLRPLLIDLIPNPTLHKPLAQTVTRLAHLLLHHNEISR